MNHRDAADVIRRTAPSWAGPRARRLVQAVAWHESTYGQGWHRTCPQMDGSHNWGAIQGAPGALCRDTHADGTPYHWSYRIYASDDAGARDLWRELLRRPAVVRVLVDDALDPEAMAIAMRSRNGGVGGYFEASTASYTKALRAALDAISRGA